MPCSKPQDIPSPDIDLVDFLFGLFPRVKVLLGPVYMTSRVGNLPTISEKLIGEGGFQVPCIA